MEGYRELTKTISVPANTGIDGFLRALRQILRKPLVQQITISSKGSVVYNRYVREDEPEESAGISFDDLQPYYVVRNSDLQEFMPPDGLSAATVLGMMFDRIAQDRLHPIALVVGADSSLWAWYAHTTGHVPVARKQLLGLPIFTDRQIPDSVLLMCAGFGRDSTLIDTQISYKVEIPQYALPSFRSEVQVIP